MTEDRSGREIRCIVRDKAGTSVISNTATIGSVDITNMPSSQEVLMGQWVTISVGMNYDDGIKYQWQFKEKGTDRWLNSSVTNSIYTVKMISKRDGRSFRCILTDVNGNQIITETAEIHAQESMVTNVACLMYHYFSSSEDINNGGWTLDNGGTITVENMYRRDLSRCGTMMKDSEVPDEYRAALISDMQPLNNQIQEYIGNAPQFFAYPYNKPQWQYYSFMTEQFGYQFLFAGNSHVYSETIGNQFVYSSGLNAQGNVL